MVGVKQRKARKLSTRELRARASSAPKRTGTRNVKSQQHERDEYVAEYAKRQALGKCQLCRNEAPFANKKGEPYLESHHIVWLSKGGEDSISNTVALCPNCHRKMHILNTKEDVTYLKGVVDEQAAQIESA